MSRESFAIKFNGFKWVPMSTLINCTLILVQMKRTELSNISTCSFKGMFWVRSSLNVDIAALLPWNNRLCSWTIYLRLIIKWLGLPSACIGGLLESNIGLC